MGKTRKAFKQVDKQGKRQQPGCSSKKADKEMELKQGPSKQEHIRVEEMEQVFSNPLGYKLVLWDPSPTNDILKEILKNLSVESLLKTSLINKLWCTLSRENLRSRNCVAAIAEHGYSCLRLQQFNNTLTNSNDVPFVGLSICIEKTHHYDYCSNAHVYIEDFICNIFRKMDFNHLALKIDIVENFGIRRWDCACKACVKIVQALFKTNPSLIRSLKLCADLRKPVELFSTIFKRDKIQLPNCRCIELVSVEGHPNRENGGYNQLPLETLEECLTVCPNLQRIAGKIGPEHLEEIMKTNIILREFHYVPFIDCIERALTFATTSSKMEKLAIATTRTGKSAPYDEPRIFEWNFDEQIIVNETLELLLRRNQDFLTRLDVHHYDLIRLVTPEGIGLPVLRNVKTLKLLYCDGIDSKEECATLRKINWNEYFPNLTHVYATPTWTTTPDASEHEFYIKDNFRNIPPQFTCETVRKIILSGIIILNGSQMTMFRDVFPNVKEVAWSPSPSVHTGDFFKKDNETLAPTTFQHFLVWGELERLFISMETPAWWITHDSTFLTISENRKHYCEELEELLDIEEVGPNFELKLPDIDPKLPPSGDELPDIDGPCALNYKEDDGLEAFPKQQFLFSSKYLKTVEIQVATPCHKCKRGNYPEDTLRLNNHCRFQHADGLEIKIYRNICEVGPKCNLALDHLQPCVQLCHGKCPNIPLDA